MELLKLSNIDSLSEVDEKKSKELYHSQDVDSLVNGNDKNQKKSEKGKAFIGFFYTFLTCLCYTLASVIIKKLWYISPAEITFVRSIGIFAGALPVAVYYVKDVLGEKKSRGLLLLRGLTGSICLLCMSTSYKYLPIAEATTVLSAFPVVTTIVARILLKEACGIVQSLLLVLCVCGVLLCVRLPELLSSRGKVVMDFAYIAGLMAALGCVFLQSAVFIILRKIKHVHFSIPMLYYGAVGSIVNASINFAFDSTGFEPPLCGRDQIFVLLVGVFGCLGNLVNTIAIQVEGAGIVSALRTMEIVMAMILQVVFFGDTPDVYNICGGCLVTFSLSMMGLRKWMLMLPKDSNTRKRFTYLIF